MVIDNMMDLGAESVNIGKYFPPAFAESVRRYEELAEGTRSILLFSLFVQDK